MNELNSYELSRAWFDWCFENTDLVKPTHTALYFFAIEHCNRLGWKEKFGLPKQMTMDAIGVKNWRTFSDAFEDVVEWGFFKVHERSKNQYSATVIGIVKNAKANTKALSKAMQKHSQKHCNGIVVIDKPINQETNTIKQREIEFIQKVKTEFKGKYSETMLQEFCNYWTEPNKSNKKMRFELQQVFETSRRLATWAGNNFKKTNNGYKHPAAIQDNGKTYTEF